MTSKAALRRRLAEYRSAYSSLVTENLELRHGFNQIYADLQRALQKIENTEDFLAVLQGEQLDTTN